MANIVAYDEDFLSKSWFWLNDEEIRELTMTPKFTRSEQIEFYNSIPDRKDYKIFGVTHMEQKVGVCGLKNIKLEESAEYWGYIGEREFWGRGIGSDIIDMMLTEAKVLKVKEVYLTVGVNNARAVNLYKRKGFVIKDTYKKNGFIQHLMTKILIKNDVVNVIKNSDV